MIETTYAKVLAGKREFVARGAPRLFAAPLTTGSADSESVPELKALGRVVG